MIHRDDGDRLAAKLAELDKRIEESRELNRQLRETVDDNLGRYQRIATRLGMAEDHLLSAQEEIKAAGGTKP